MENIDGAIKNGQSRGTGNIGHKTQNNDKQSKTQHRKLKDEQQGTYHKFSGVHWCLRRLSSSYKTSSMLLVVETGKSIISDRGKIKFYVKEKRAIPGTPVSSNNETDRHDITEILLKVTLSSTTSNPVNFCKICHDMCVLNVLYHYSSKEWDIQSKLIYSPLYEMQSYCIIFSFIKF